MEIEDDNLVVFVVVNNDEKGAQANEEVLNEPTEIINNIGTAKTVDTILEQIKDYQNVKFMKEENQEMSDFKEEYLDENYVVNEQEIKSEEQFESDNVDNINDCDDPVYEPKSKRRHIKQESYKSFVEELRQEYVELRKNERKLVSTLERIMKNVKPPDPPRDHYIINGIMFECVVCGNLSVTIPAADRHFHEKHGPRYLMCFACGLDFRSTINLYKHEKRCRAPDAHIVLKARAAMVGSKGRGRPYLSYGHRASRHSSPSQKKKGKPAKTYTFPCKWCSAVFASRPNLHSHENLHRGERPYHCSKCPKAYTSQAALNKHMEVHANAEYICDYCQRSFKTRAIIIAHLRVHKPIRKHGCLQCERHFAQKSALQLHVDRVHRNLPPPCACHVCPKRFPRMSILTDHMKKVHGITIMTREMFFKKLPTMSERELKETQVQVFRNEKLSGNSREKCGDNNK